MTLEPEEGRVLQWLASEYQRQARGPRSLDEIEQALQLKRGRVRELLEHSATLAQVVSVTRGRDGGRVWLTSDGYTDALNLLAGLPQRH